MSIQNDLFEKKSWVDNVSLKIIDTLKIIDAKGNYGRKKIWNYFYIYINRLWIPLAIS